MLPLRNEWRVLRRHPLIWCSLVASLLFSAAVVQGSPVDPHDGAAAALLWFNILYPMFVLPFVAGALAPIFYLREIDHGMTEIFGSYPVATRHWLAARVGTLTLLMWLIALLSQLAHLLFLFPHDPGEGAVLFAGAAKGLIILQLPNCLLWASILAWVASCKAHSGLIYVTAGLLWLGYNALAAVSGSPMIAGSGAAFEPLRHAMRLLDPYGGAALMGVVDDNGLFSSRGANLAVGRIFWLAATFALLAHIRAIPARIPHQDARRSAPNRNRQPPRARKRGAPSQIGLHLRYFVRDKVFPLLILGWLALLLPDVIGGMDWAEPLSRIDPDSRDALNRVIWDVVIGAGALLLLYTADRICRLYSGTAMHELYAATPHRPARLVMVQLVGVLVAALFFVALAGLAVVAAQWALQSPIDPMEYARQLGLAYGRLALFGLFFVALHGLNRRRFVANLAGVLLVTFALSPALPMLGLHHPLWRPMGTPILAPDHYWGFGGSLAGHQSYTAFWAAIGVAALFVAVARHHRSLPFARPPLAATIRHPAIALAVLAAGAATAQAIHIDRQIARDGRILSPQQRHAWRAEYERRYAHWADIAQPDVEAIDARVDFAPSKQSVRLRAELILLNRTAKPIRAILVSRNQIDAGTTRISMPGAAQSRRDAQAGQMLFTLARPLQPGARTPLRVEVQLSQSSVASPSFPFVLRPAFNSLPAYALLPMVGYRRELLLRDPANRKEQGLPPLAILPPSRLGAQMADRVARHQLRLNAVVTTEAGHHALGQGRLLRQWSENGRPAFHYRTDAPIRAMPAFFSIAGKPVRWTHGASTLQIFSPDPMRADDPNVQGMRDALSFLGTEIGPYPGATLSLLAVPDIGFSGYALPQIVQVSHRLAFRARPTADAGFNQIYRRAAHETAHQWFGHHIGYGVAEERAFLIESLAKYAELVLVERRYGPQAMRALVAYEHDRYRTARRDLSRKVVPLIDATDNYDQYSRATLVFACLRQQLGDDAITEAIRTLAMRSRQQGRAALSIDFVAHLSAAAPSRRMAIRLLLLGDTPIGEALESTGCGQIGRAITS